MYPTWLFLYMQVIILPTFWLSAMATKILMKKEMKRYLFGNSVHPVQCEQSMRFQGDNIPLGSLQDNNPEIIITPPED